MRKRKLMLIYGMIACMSAQTTIPALAAEPPEEAVEDSADRSTPPQ